MFISFKAIELGRLSYATQPIARRTIRRYSKKTHTAPNCREANSHFLSSIKNVQPTPRLRHPAQTHQRSIASTWVSVVISAGSNGIVAAAADAELPRHHHAPFRARQNRAGRAPALRGRDPALFDLRVSEVPGSWDRPLPHRPATHYAKARWRTAKAMRNSYRVTHLSSCKSSRRPRCIMRTRSETRLRILISHSNLVDFLTREIRCEEA